MERHFDEELKRLNQELIRMSDLVKKAIQNSVESLNSMNRKQAEDVITHDHEIDLMELEILVEKINDGFRENNKILF